MTDVYEGEVNVTASAMLNLHHVPDPELDRCRVCGFRARAETHTASASSAEVTTWLDEWASEVTDRLRNLD